MNKLLLRSLVLIATVIFFITPAFAVKESGTPTKYVIKLKTLKLLNEDDAWVTVYSGTSPGLDIASVVSGSNQYVGEFLSGLEVPDGTYTSAMVQPDTTFILKGTVDGRGTDGGSHMGSTEWGCTSIAGFTPVDCTLTVNSVPIQGPYPFDAVVVKDGVADHKIRIYFTVADAITDNEDTGLIYPETPVCTVVSIAK